MSAAGLSVLAVAMGVSFAGSTGTSSITVSGGSTNFVYSIGNSVAIPDGIDALKYSTTINTTANTVTTADSPSWTPISNSAGTVSASGAGDLALVDATGVSLLLSLFVLDLTELQQAYSSFAWVINIYRCASSCTSASAWTQAPTTVIPAGGTYLTHNEGFLSFKLATGYYYEVTIDAGGSFYSTDASSSDNNGPEFYFSSQPL